MQFDPLSVDEVISTLLPNLIVGGWTFDSGLESDKEIGQLLWMMAAPSLRKLRNILERASSLARFRNGSRIEEQDIREAFNWSATNSEIKRLKKLESSSPTRRQEHSLEDESELRHLARKGRGRV
jgi:hypothetical protein